MYQYKNFTAVLTVETKLSSSPDPYSGSLSSYCMKGPAYMELLPAVYNQVQYKIIKLHSELLQRMQI